MKKEKLFEGANTETKPKPRTVEEIKAKYRKPGVISWKLLINALHSRSTFSNIIIPSRMHFQQLQKQGTSLQNAKKNSRYVASCISYDLIILC